MWCCGPRRPPPEARSPGGGHQGFSPTTRCMVDPQTSTSPRTCRVRSASAVRDSRFRPKLGTPALAHGTRSARAKGVSRTARGQGPLATTRPGAIRRRRLLRFQRLPGPVLIRLRGDKQWGEVGIKGGAHSHLGLIRAASTREHPIAYYHGGRGLTWHHLRHSGSGRTTGGVGGGGGGVGAWSGEASAGRGPGVLAPGPDPGLGGPAGSGRWT